MLPTANVRAFQAAPNKLSFTRREHEGSTVCTLSRPRVSTKASLRDNAEFVTALFSAASKQTRPWLEDLILPFLDIPHGPDGNSATRTVHRTQLADEDSKFVTVHGIELHYKEWVAPGSDPLSCPTILLLHGFNGSVFSWRANGFALAQAAGGCRVIAFDRPPFGLSERPDVVNGPPFNPYNADGNVTLTEGLLDVLGLFKRPLVVLGHSAGAAVALNLYSRRPQDISALVLVAPAVPTTLENQMLRNATFGALLRFFAVRTIIQSDDVGLRYVRRQLMRQRDRILAGELGFKPHPSTAQASETEDDDDDDEALKWAIQGYLKPLKAHDWDKAALLNLRSFNLPASYPYKSLRVPVLVVQGKFDGQLTKNARALRTLLPPNPKTMYKELECGHVPMDELPQEFNAIVKEYVDNVFLPNN
jgi:pimeloyl-ACP methyl ester carboxylesterase